MRATILLSALALLTAGCNGDPSPEEACDDLAYKACNKLQSCSPFYVEAVYGDVSTCITRMKIDCLPSPNFM